MSQSPQWLATARLLRRMGFGATGPGIDAMVNGDRSAYLDDVLDADPEADPGARPAPEPTFPPAPDYPGKDASPAVIADWNKRVDDGMAELSLWWINRMTTVHEPVHEKLTLVWHNHFATSAAKVRHAVYMGEQNRKLRTFMLGDFRDLALAMLTDAAMLWWLDGRENVAASPNENLSREFMELFALGHANGYSETDVREGARALTGWKTTPDAHTSVMDAKHDARNKTVLGVTGDLDAASFCDAVLAQPRSAEYVAGRLWRQLASDMPASPETLDRLVAAYGRGRDLKALTKAVLMDPEFATGTSVNSPIEWVVGVMRTLSITLESHDMAYALNDLLTTLGQRILYPPDVSGWPRGRVWVSTASASAQAWAANELAKRGNLSAIEEAAKSDRIDAVGYMIGVGAWSDRSAKALQPFADSPPELFTVAVNTPEYLTS